MAEAAATDTWGLAGVSLMPNWTCVGVCVELAREDTGTGLTATGVATAVADAVGVADVPADVAAGAAAVAVELVLAPALAAGFSPNWNFGPALAVAVAAAVAVAVAVAGVVPGLLPLHDAHAILSAAFSLIHVLHRHFFSPPALEAPQIDPALLVVLEAGVDLTFSAFFSPTALLSAALLSLLLLSPLLSAVTASSTASTNAFLNCCATSPDLNRIENFSSFGSPSLPSTAIHTRARSLPVRGSMLIFAVTK